MSPASPLEPNSIVLRSSFRVLGCATLAALSFSLSTACNDMPRRGGAAASRPSASAALPAASAPLPVSGPEERLAPLRQRTYAVAIDGSLAYVGTEAGVTVFDLHRADEPKSLAEVTLPGSVNNLALLGGPTPRLAVSVGPSGLVLFDVSAARAGKLVPLNTAPWPATQRGACHSAWNAASCSGEKAFVACGTGGVAEVDLRTPAEPRVTRVLPVDDYARDVAVLDTASGVPAGKSSTSLVAAAAGASGLIVIDFAAAGEPKVVATLPSAAETRALAVRGGLAYLAEGAAGVRIVDLHDPAKPAVVGSLRPDTTDMIRGITVAGTTAWLCAGDSGLLAVDVSTPASPRQVGAYDPERAINRAALLDRTVVAANDADGLVILDAQDPASPRVVYPKQHR